MKFSKFLALLVLILLEISISQAATNATNTTNSTNATSVTAVDGLGVNWGTVTYHPLPMVSMIQLLKDNGIKKVKLFDVDHDILTGLVGTDIEVMVTITNGKLADMGNYDTAKDWVKRNLTRYLDLEGGVNIAYVAVGNEPFLKDYNGTFNNVTFPALKNVQNALNEANYTHIKATIPLNADVYYSPDYNPVPSAGVFRDDIADLMGEIIEFYHNNSCPFTVNIYPFLSLFYGKGKFPIDYAFFDGNLNPLMDNGVAYTNVLDANYDTLASVLNKAGYKDMPIIVGEIGWPTDGDVNANVSYAQNFYQGMVKHLAAKQGTPLRPNTTMQVYVFGLIDEDGKSILPGNFERHWGIFTYDGQPKFQLDITGKGGKNTLVPAKNVTYLAKQWCVLNPNMKNTTALEDNTNYACQNADCTSLSYGSSCSSLDSNGQASYSFNSYYQNFNQQNASCHFDGFAMITTKDPSTGTCKFDVALKPIVPASAPAPAPVLEPTDAPGSGVGSTGSGSNHGSKGGSTSSAVTAAMSSIGTIVLCGLLSLLLA
ncbi:hypothetical protein LUZ60_004668 [Juncus effusus]|nr:hypothetical protein LUZ60_004668 [Juncus effusus]